MQNSTGVVHEQATPVVSPRNHLVLNPADWHLSNQPDLLLAVKSRIIVHHDP